MDFFRKTFTQLLEWLARCALRRPWLIVSVWALVTLVSAYLSFFHLGVMGNTNDLIQSDSPIHKLWLDYVRDFKAREEILVVIQSPDRLRNRQAVEKLVSLLPSDPRLVERVYYKNDFSKIKQKALLLQNLDELRDLETQSAQLAQTLRKRGGTLDLNLMLTEANTEFARLEKEQGRGLDDFGKFAGEFVQKLTVLADKLEASSQPGDRAAGVLLQGVKAQDRSLSRLDEEFARREFLEFADGKMFLVLIRPGPPADNSFTPYADPIHAIRKAVAEVRTLDPTLTIGLTGEPILMQDEVEMSSRDTIISSVVCFLIIALIVFISFHELIRPATAIATLLCVVFWTLGFGAAFIGHLNIISQATIIMIVGHGVDFGIQIISRYEEELSRGLPFEVALVTALKTTGLAIVTTGIINALAFFTMCFNSFIGLHEMGILAGAGLLLAIIGYVTLMPALLVLADRRRVIRPEKIRHIDMVTGRRLETLFFSRPRAALTGVLVVSALAVALLPRLSFDHNLLNLQARDTEAIRTLRDLDTHAMSILFAIVRADSIEDSRRKAAQISGLPSVKSVRGVHDLIPDHQPEKLAILRRIQGHLKKAPLDAGPPPRMPLEATRAKLAELLKNSLQARDQARSFSGISSQAKKALEIFEKLIPALQRSVAALDRLSPAEATRKLLDYDDRVMGEMRRGLLYLRDHQPESPITPADVPLEILSRYQSVSGTSFALEVEAKKDLWERQHGIDFLAQLRTVDPHVTGTPVQNTVFIALLKESFIQAALLSLLSIIVLVWLHFRNVQRLILVLIPLGIAVLWTLGFMGGFDVRFNPANIVALPLIIGIGMSFGVYIIDRFDEDGEVNIFCTSTGKAMFLTGLTTSVSFACMIPGEYRGLSSLGLIMTISMTLCLFTGLIVLPQILIVLQQMGWLKPRPPLSQ